MSYIFFYDESFHDRKIKINNDRINALRDDSIDNYIGVFWGCKEEQLKKITNAIRKFEYKYKKIFSLNDCQELKSTTIGKGNFKYGLQSFNRVTMQFYTDLFNLIGEISPVIQINAISKIEFFLLRALNGIIFPPYYRINEGAFYYSLTKFVIIYNNPKLISSLYNIKSSKDIENFRNELLHDLETIISLDANITRKKSECKSFLQLYDIIYYSNLKISVDTEYNFNYKIVFDGLCKLLEELNINKNEVSIIIDNENGTYEDAKKYGFQNVCQKDSREDINLHLSDFISGFIGRIIYAIYHDESFTEDKIKDIDRLSENNLVDKRILSQNWFDIDKEQFELYHTIERNFLKILNHYWNVHSLRYRDQIIMFITLIQYFSYFKTYEEYKKIDIRNHPEYYNNYACSKLMEYYNRTKMERK